MGKRHADYKRMENKELNNAVSQVKKDLTAGKNPVAGIHKEVEKAKHAPKKTGVLTVKSANDCVEDAAKSPDPKTFFNGLIPEFENTVLFAASGVGKSVLGVQVAENIARTEKVFYLDLELSEKQFGMRYSDRETGEIHIFPPNFMRAEVDPELIGGVNLEQEILKSIEIAAIQGTKFVIVDNLTFICRDAERSSIASEFMMKLIRLKKKYGLTTIVIAHTPKRRGYEPITHNDLAGSSKLISFFDAGIALARSAQDDQLRYLKQVKVRTGEYKYDSDNVMVLDLVKSDGFLHFEVVGYGHEDDHLKKGNPAEDVDEIYDILRLKNQGKSLREIAKTLGISLGKVQRRLKKAEEENIKLPGDDPISPVSDVSGKEVAIQPIHDTDQTLPMNDEED